MKYLVNLIKYKFFSKIDDNLIVFISFNGKYADNPKFITNYIHTLDKNKKIVWLVNNINNDEIPKYVTKIKYGTKEAWNYYCKAKIVIDNVYCMHEYYLEEKNFKNIFKYKIISYLKNKKGINYFTFWHGTPLKKIGIDAVNSKINDFSCPNTTLIIDNKYTLDVMKRITYNKLNYVLLGSPKNEYLLENKENIESLKEKLNLPNKKIVLYAPSFRTGANGKDDVEKSGINQINDLKINDLLLKFQEKFGDECVLVCRFHYKVEALIDWNKLHKMYGDKVINGNQHEDIVEYLKCSDILITDMSSCLFEFSLMSKPVFLFFPDVENYKSKERGMYMNIEELPFSCSKNYLELIQNIENYNEKSYSSNLKQFMSKFGFYIPKNAGENIAKYILECTDDD